MPQPPMYPRNHASIAWQYRDLAGKSRQLPVWRSGRIGLLSGGFRSIGAVENSLVDPPDGESDRGTPEQKMARLRAVLFLAKEPLTSRKLSQYSNLADGTEARTLVARLNRQFDENGRAFRAEAVAGGYQLMTRPQFAKWLRRLEHVPGNMRLSAPAMETLSVVAYRQPVLRAEVEAVRGVGCGEMLAQLLNRDLIRISGRSEELGRPYLYSTTKRFLMIFGLRNLEELPRADLFKEVDDDHADEMIASNELEPMEISEATKQADNEEN